MCSLRIDGGCIASVFQWSRWWQPQGLWPPGISKGIHPNYERLAEQGAHLRAVKAQVITGTGECFRGKRFKWRELVERMMMMMMMMMMEVEMRVRLEVCECVRKHSLGQCLETRCVLYRS